MKKAIVLLTAAALPLSACNTVENLSNRMMPSTIEPVADNGGKCDASGLNGFVGKEATVELGTDAVKQSGASRLRWLPPRSAVTMDYREDRLNIGYDDNMIVTALRCG